MNVPLFKHPEKRGLSLIGSYAGYVSGTIKGSLCFYSHLNNEKEKSTIISPPALGIFCSNTYFAKKKYEAQRD